MNIGVSGNSKSYPPFVNWPSSTQSPRLNTKPLLRQFGCDNTSVIQLNLSVGSLDLLRGVSAFLGDLINVLHLREPVGDVAVPECILLPLYLRFFGSSEEFVGGFCEIMTRHP